MKHFITLKDIPKKDLRKIVKLRDEMRDNNIDIDEKKDIPF